MDLAKLTVLITGATGGIGQALALQLASRGTYLVLTGRDSQALTELQAKVTGKGGRCRTVAADLNSEDGRQQVLQCCLETPMVNALVNSAGTNSFVSFSEQTPEQIESLMQTNLISPMLLTRMLLPLLLKQPDSTLITIGSTFGSIGYPGYSTYCASKFGLRGFHEALQRELADTSVRTVYVAPRATQTGINSEKVVAMNKELGNQMDSPDWVAQQVVQAMQTNRRSAYLGWPEKLFVRLNALFPGLVTGAIVKQLPVIKKYLLQSS
ncbi:short chain dehydrogenase [Hahella sp. CCB-MM4]|uniref:SDR family oxidoreductase n=1 Tax=Hahella sp. (strain CCB-MM4) TaxID=1926491 RepID=UPI000B9C580F|nr:SDR family oxidoreductase [Hahella sp. CCB-MM4]OZG71029.1 short chain dehydrogenase [Hahella sp. CCB-MM4]